MRANFWNLNRSTLQWEKKNDSNLSTVTAYILLNKLQCNLSLLQDFVVRISNDKIRGSLEILENKGLLKVILPFHKNDFENQNTIFRTFLSTLNKENIITLKELESTLDCYRDYLNDHNLDPKSNSPFTKKRKRENFEARNLHFA